MYPVEWSKPPILIGMFLFWKTNRSPLRRVTQRFLQDIVARSQHSLWDLHVSSEPALQYGSIGLRCTTFLKAFFGWEVTLHSSFQVSELHRDFTWLCEGRTETEVLLKYAEDCRALSHMNTDEKCRHAYLAVQRVASQRPSQTVVRRHIQVSKASARLEHRRFQVWLFKVRCTLLVLIRHGTFFSQLNIRQAPLDISKLKKHLIQLANLIPYPCKY